MVTVFFSIYKFLEILTISKLIALVFYVIYFIYTHLCSFIDEIRLGHILWWCRMETVYCHLCNLSHLNFWIITSQYGKMSMKSTKYSKPDWSRNIKCDFPKKSSLFTWWIHLKSNLPKNHFTVAKLQSNTRNCWRTYWKICKTEFPILFPE